MLPLSAKEHQANQAPPEPLFEAINELLKDKTPPILISAPNIAATISQQNPGFKDHHKITQYFTEIAKAYEKAGWSIIRDNQSLIFSYKNAP